jgi:curved DNA-binding protein CbpA
MPVHPSNRSNCCRRRSVTLQLSFFLLYVLVFVLLTIPETANGQFSSSQEPQCKPQEPTKYDWERLNYYELLGLTEDEGSSGSSSSKTKKKKKKGRGLSRSPINNNEKKNGDKANANGDEEGRNLTSKEIRKAYRKQAQEFHPDKQASKKKSSSSGIGSGIGSGSGSGSGKSSTSSSSSNAISVEESNARFAKIAEAYEFLLDDTKRKDYDLFLEYCHNTEIVKDDDVHEGRLSTMLKKRFHGLFDDLVGSRDPFKVFKDAFFGGDDDIDNDVYFDPNDPFSHLRYENNPQRHPNHQQYHPNEEQPYDPQEDPLRVFHEKRFMYDPMTGENVVRVLQTEEYAPSSREKTRGSTRSGNSTFSSSPHSPSSFYYRIVAQDFRESYDPYTANQIYVPITEPYLQEDGFRKASASRDQTAKSSSSSSSSTGRSSSNVESILHPWEVLTPRSPPMVSPNKRYIAGLSADCELLVMINPDRHGDDNEEIGKHGNGYKDAPQEILWSTQRPYGKDGYVSDHCFALLKGPHLVVTVGQHPQQTAAGIQNNRILWHSDGRNDEDDSRHGYYEYEDEFGFWHKRQRSYLAQLDNDGSLTVYSVWSVPQDDSSSEGYNHQNYQQQLDQQLPRTKVLVSNFAMAAKDLLHGRIQTKNEYDHLYSTSRSLTYKRCVYSTHGGSNLPLGIGCYRISRKLNQLAIEVTLAVRKLVFQINLFADAWLDLIYEEDDIFYFVKESIWKNTLCSKYSKVAGSSARWVRKILEGLKQLTPGSNNGSK